MKQFNRILLMSLAVILASCAGRDGLRNNPFMNEYNTPFGVPPFDEIKSEHFMPAFQEGMRQQTEEVAAITGNSEAPTFENTILELEYSGGLLYRVSAVFFNYNAANISPEIQAIATEVAPLLSAHTDDITLNTELFARIKTIYEQKDQLGLNPEEMMLLEETYKSFVRNGALLPIEKQERFREINKELSVLEVQFGQNVLGDVNNFKMFIDNQEDLAGLPQSAIDAAAEAAKNAGQEGKWLFTLHNPSVMPFLYHASNRELREKMNRAFINRGNNDNEFNNHQIINRTIELRLERSQMLGFETYASFAISDRMAETTENVVTFLQKVWDAALPIAKEERQLMQDMIDAKGGNFDLAFWDWRYYSERIREQKYNLNEAEISEYFEINNVRDGIFMIVEKLWGIKFVERTDIPVYHPDVTAWEALEADGTHIGILYMDMHPRAGKRSGAWMSSFRIQHIDREGTFVHPVITIVCNFTAPTGDQPALLTYDEMLTFLHEFGHALHGLLSNVTFQSLAGTSVPTDFVELPAQIMENWANHPDVLRMFARHYKTGDTIPDDLINRIEASSDFNQGFATVEFVASAWLDMDYHTKSTFSPFTIADFEQGVKTRHTMIDEIYFRHGSTHFQHIFSGGYSAGYYSYLWAGILDADAFEAFVETGDLFDQETARRFREEILERGGTRKAMDMYVGFRGKEPGIEPLLRQRGLLR